MSRAGVISREILSNLIGEKKKKTIRQIYRFWEGIFVVFLFVALFTNVEVYFAAVNDYQKAKSINEHLHKVGWSELFFFLQRPRLDVS